MGNRDDSISWTLRTELLWTDVRAGVSRWMQSPWAHAQGEISFIM